MGASWPTVQLLPVVESCCRYAPSESAIAPLAGDATDEQTLSAAVEHVSPDASFVTGAIVPVDGGRSILGQDPEARDVTASADA